jgi:tetratricopeptide (TPR) repeat protein
MRIAPLLTFRAGRRPGIASLLIVVVLVLTACGSGAPKHTSSSTSSGPLDSRSANTLIEAGIAQANAKRYQQAETTFRNVLVLSPGNKFAWYNLGLLAEVQNHQSAALTYYSNALTTDPRYTPAMYNKAILLEDGDLRLALALYQRITSINPKAATAYLRESFVYARLGDKGNASQARARAVALDPSLAKVGAPAAAGSK